MDNMNRLFELTFSHGGPGEVKAELDESPSTQAYYQAAAQNLPDYAQALADIHRQGDLDREAFNLIMPFYNNGLNNLYKEKLKEKEFQNDLAKTQLTYDLADRNQKNNLNLQDQLNWKKYLWDRQNALADRSHTESREDQLYDRQLKLLLDERNRDARRRLQALNPESMINNGELNSRNITLYDLDANKIFDKKDFNNSIVDKNTNKLVEEAYNQVNKSATVPDVVLSPQDWYNRIKRYLLSNATYENEYEVLQAINDLDKMYENYLNNEYSDIYSDNFKDKPLKDNEVVELIGNPDEVGYFNGLINSIFGGRDLTQYENYLKQNAYLLPYDRNQKNYYVNKLRETINQTSPELLQSFGFTNTNGMGDKEIFLSKEVPGEFFVYERGSKNIRRFRPQYNRQTRDIDFVDNGLITTETLDKMKNNYNPESLSFKGQKVLYNAGNATGNVLKKTANGTYLNKLFDTINNNISDETFYNFRNSPALVTKDGENITYGDLISPSFYLNKLFRMK